MLLNWAMDRRGLMASCLTIGVQRRVWYSGYPRPSLIIAVIVQDRADPGVVQAPEDARPEAMCTLGP